jgi:hypothetical protein
MAGHILTRFAGLWRDACWGTSRTVRHAAPRRCRMGV